MDNIPAQEVSTVEIKKSSSKFFLVFLIILVITVIIGYLYLTFKDKIPNLLNFTKEEEIITEEATSPFSSLVVPESKIEESGLVGTTVLTYETALQDGSNYSEPTRYIHLLSSGDVYTKDLILNNGIKTKLYILKGTLLNEKPIDAVIAIYLEDYQEEYFNWWFSNFTESVEELNEISKPPLDELKFESIFKENTRWKYTFLSDFDSGVPDWYLEVAKKVYENSNPNKLASDIVSYSSTDLLLMPRLIYEEE